MVLIHPHLPKKECVKDAQMMQKGQNARSWSIISKKQFVKNTPVTNYFGLLNPISFFNGFVMKCILNILEMKLE